MNSKAKQPTPLMSEAEAIEKFKGKIWTQDGNYNLRTVKQIALAAGLIKPIVFRGDTIPDLYIEWQLIDPNGSDPAREVKYLYNLCMGISKQQWYIDSLNQD